MYGKHKIFKASTRKNDIIKILSIRCIKLAQNKLGDKNFRILAYKVEAVDVTQIYPTTARDRRKVVFRSNHVF
jgi:hypothetical protein